MMMITMMVIIYIYIYIIDKDFLFCFLLLFLCFRVRNNKYRSKLYKNCSRPFFKECYEFLNGRFPPMLVMWVKRFTFATFLDNSTIFRITNQHCDINVLDNDQWWSKEFGLQIKRNMQPSPIFIVCKKRLNKILIKQYLTVIFTV